MKAGLFFAIWIGAGTLASANDSLDHLLPSALADMPAYQAILVFRLGKVPFDCGRTIFVPHEGPEYCISVHSSAHKFYVTYFVAEETIYSATDFGRHISNAPRTHRVDVELPADTAEKLKRIWLAMLTGSHEPRPTPPPERRVIPLHSSFAEFTIQRPQGAMPVGYLNLSLKAPGPLTGDLAAVAKLLVDVCKASSAARPNILSQINSKSAAFLDVLKAEQMHKTARSLRLPTGLEESERSAAGGESGSHLSILYSEVAGQSAGDGAPN
jgi:hypothetical protein